MYFCIIIIIMKYIIDKTNRKKKISVQIIHYGLIIFIISIILYNKTFTIELYFIKYDYYYK